MLTQRLFQQGQVPGSVPLQTLFQLHSVLLGFGGVIFPLAGVPQLEGYANERERVRTQKVVQSRKWRENPLSNSHWARDFSCPVALVKPITRDPSSWAKQVVVAEVK